MLRLSTTMITLFSIKCDRLDCYLFNNKVPYLSFENQRTCYTNINSYDGLPYQTAVINECSAFTLEILITSNNG